MKVEMRGDTLVIEIDCSAAARERAPESKSKKTRLLATTNGFSKIGDVSVNLNVTVPPVQTDKQI